VIKKILALAIVSATVLVVFAGCIGTNPPPGNLQETPVSNSSLKETPTGDFEYGYNADLSGVVIKKYIGTSMSVHIPKKIEGDPVISIGEKAFQYSGIMEIYIPNSVTQIGGDAFSYCAGLTSVTIPDSVTQIDAWAFTGCLGLTNITIPDSVREIESEVFSYCTELTNATYKGAIYNLSTTDGRRGLYAAINGGK